MHPASVLPELGRGAGIAARHKRQRGTTVSYRDSQAAAATFVVLSAHKGFRVGSRCLAKRPRASKSKLGSCTRYLRVGGFAHSDLAGANSFHFTGRINGRALLVGRYRLQAVARSSAGKSSRPVAVGFEIIG